MGIEPKEPTEAIKHGLVVSCQAHGDHPLRNPAIMAALAICAEKGGAMGIRADGPQDIEAIRATISLPIVGIHKVPLSPPRFFITPTFEHARDIVSAGTDIVGLETTFENRPDARELEDLIRRVRELGAPVMADISTFEEGMRAWESGADLVSTTLSGYTRESRNYEKPDLKLVGRLADTGVRAVCEVHIRTPEQVAAAFEQGAWSVVVGTPITDPIAITSWFARPTHEHASGTISQEARP